MASAFGSYLQLQRDDDDDDISTLCETEICEDKENKSKIIIWEKNYM